MFPHFSKMFPHFGALGKTLGKRLVKHLGHFAAICGDLRFISQLPASFEPPISTAHPPIFRITPKISKVELEGVGGGKWSRESLCGFDACSFRYFYLFGETIGSSVAYNECDSPSATPGIWEFIPEDLPDSITPWSMAMRRSRWTSSSSLAS